MQGICPNATQQVDCGGQTLNPLCPAPQTVMLPVQKRFLFPKRQRAIHPSQGPWVSVKLPSSHTLANPQIWSSRSQFTFGAKRQMLQAEGWEGEGARLSLQNVSVDRNATPSAQMFVCASLSPHGRRATKGCW